VTNPSPDTRAPQPRWNRQQIRAARLAPLLPILSKRGLALEQLPAGNFHLSAYPGLLIKENYWRWPERDLSGNTIDFLTKILGLSFNDAMRLIQNP